MDVPIARYSIAKLLPPFFFKQRDRRKCWEPFLCVFAQLNPKNQKFLKMDVPIARYSIVQLATCFSSNNEIDESVGNLFCASRAAESKKPKIFKNGRSYRPLFNCKAIAPFFLQTTRQTKVLGTFFVRLAQMNPKNQKFLKMDVPIARYSIVQLLPPFFFKQRDRRKCWEPFLCVFAAESKKPKIFKNGRSYRPLFNCKAIAPFFFKQRDRRKCWEPFLCVSRR